MDIAFVTNVVYPFVSGGAQKRVHEIGTRLAARGHDVTVYGRHFWDGPPVRDHEGMTLRAIAPERDIYAGDRRSIPEAVEFATRLYRPLRRSIAAHDVVDVSVFPYFPVLTSALAGRSTATALVTTWHEVWEGYWTEYLGPLGAGGRAVERAVAWLPQRPIAVSRQTADRLARIGPPRERIEVIPNGVDVEWIESVTPASDGFDVLFAGRLTDAKNVDVLLDAFDRVADDTGATLGIIGEGPASDRLRAHVETMANGGSVTFLGFLEDYDEVIAQMAAADVFANPSTREGFGIAALEAMAAGCSVIVADHPNSAAADIVGDGGYAVEPTPAAYADALRAALGETHLPGDPRDVARQYDWSAITVDLERTYRHAADPTQTPGGYQRLDVEADQP